MGADSGGLGQAGPGGDAAGRHDHGGVETATVLSLRKARDTVDRVLSALSDPTLRERFLRAEAVRAVSSA